MSTPILTFRSESGGVHVDLERLISSRLLIQADSGGGKSRMIRYGVEQLHGRIQQIILDPEGEFASLREKFDFLLAGREGDVPTDPKTAKLLARRLLELGASAIIDLYDLKLHERREFVRLFLEELMHLPRKLWRPLLVWIDEAHVYAPQGAEASSTEAVVTLCTQGRKRGYCSILATQRISKLDKDAAAELKNRLVGSTGLDLDMKRAGDDLGFDKEQRLGLRLLEHEFWAYGPAISRQPVLVRAGNIQTTHPQPGAIAPPTPPAPTAVKKVLAQMQDLQREAAEEARTIEDLQRELAKSRIELKRAQRGVAGAAADPTAIQKQVQTALIQERRTWNAEQDAARREHAALVKQLRTQIADLTARISKVAGHLRRAEELIGLPIDEIAAPAPSGNGAAPSAARSTVERVAKPLSIAKPRQRTSNELESGDRAALSSTSRRLLDALGTLHSLGVEEAERSTIAGWSGISHTTGSFTNRLSELRTAGLIEDRAEKRIALTDHGLDVAAVIDIPDRATLHGQFLSRLSGTAARMLQVMIERYPEPISRAELAAEIGISHETGSFTNRLSELRVPGLLRDVTKTEVAATELLFPAGLD